MKEFFNEMFIETLKSGDYFLGVLFWIALIFICLAVLWGVCCIIDSIFLPTKESKCIITKKYIKPAHYITTYIKSGDVLIPITDFYEESYIIEVEVNNLKGDISVKFDFYNSNELGKKLYCTYKVGRLFKTIYIKGLINKN